MSLASLAQEAYVDQSIVKEEAETETEMTTPESWASNFSGFGFQPYPDTIRRPTSQWERVKIGPDVISYSVDSIKKGNVSTKTVSLRVEVPSIILGMTDARVTYATMSVPESATKTTFNIVREYQGVRINDQRRGKILSEVRKILTANGVDPSIGIIVVV